MFEALKMISWKQYGTFILVGCVIYYVGVGFLFYRKAILRKFLKSKQGENPFPALVGSGIEPAQADTAIDMQDSTTKARPPAALSPEQDLYPVANELVEDIDEFVVKAGKLGTVKEEVVFGIHRLISLYPALGSSGFRVAISNYITIALKNNCTFSLDDLELSALWAK